MDDEQNPQHGSAEQLAPGVWARRSDLHFTSARSSGPGGQAVNKLNTQVQLRLAVSSIQGLTERAAERLRHLAGQRLTKNDELIFQAQTHRSQLDNKRACLGRLRELIAEALIEPKVRRKTRPTRAMIERRLQEKRRQAKKKRRRSEPPDVG